MDNTILGTTPTTRETLRRAFSEDPTQLHPTTGEPLESYRMHFIDTSQYNNPPSLVDAGRAYQEEMNNRRAQYELDMARWNATSVVDDSRPRTTDRDIGIERARFNQSREMFPEPGEPFIMNEDGRPDPFTTRITYLTPSEIAERFETEVGRGLMSQINTADTYRALTPEQIRESMQEFYNTTRSPRVFQVYTGPEGMRTFDEAMRNTLGVDLGPRKWSSNPLPKYKIPTFYEQSHTDEHYIYVFKDIVTKRQLLGDTMNQAVVFATAEMEADNELVTKCKLYE